MMNLKSITKNLEHNKSKSTGATELSFGDLNLELMPG